jgi:uncharacterized protein YndB with AHSA1/START domain
MSVKKDASGRRWIEVEVEVSGTPEQVWEAIATGPGVSSWFVPTEVEAREDGAVVVTSHFGPGMDAVATATTWEPPRRFAAESRDFGPTAPPLATEWVVEARSGGTCVVRVVHSLFASSDDWDGQLESIESGWPGFFRILRLYLAHFGGQRCASFRVLGVARGPETEAWDALTGALGLAGAAADQPWRAAAGAPPLAGVVDEIDDGKHRHEILRLDEPAPGIAFLGAFAMGEQVLLTSAFYLYGDRAPAAARRDEPRWQAWMKERFPAGGEAPAVEGCA